jgi:hypothetical protein
MDCLGLVSYPSQSPRKKMRKSKLCQGTLNPSSGKKGYTDQEFPLFPLAVLDSGEWRSWSSCPAAQKTVDEQLRVLVNSLG